MFNSSHGANQESPTPYSSRKWHDDIDLTFDQGEAPNSLVLYGLLLSLTHMIELLSSRNCVCVSTLLSIKGPKKTLMSLSFYFRRDNVAFET